MRNFTLTIIKASLLIVLAITFLFSVVNVQCLLKKYLSRVTKTFFFSLSNNALAIPGEKPVHYHHAIYT